MQKPIFERAPQVRKNGRSCLLLLPGDRSELGSQGYSTSAFARYPTSEDRNGSNSTRQALSQTLSFTITAWHMPVGSLTLGAACEK